MEQQPAYRWIIVAIAALFLALVIGQLVNGLSVYLVPLELAEGWDRGEIAAINTAGLLGLGSGGLLISGIADRYGTRPTAFAGVVISGGAMAAAAGATQLWHLYAAFFVAGFAAGGAIFAPMMALVGNWFSRGAGLAIGFVSAGQALGQGVMPFSGAFLIEAFGWRGALLVQAMATLAILLPLSLLLRPPPTQPVAQRTAGGEANDGFPIPQGVLVLMIGTAGFLCCVCMSVPLIHLVPLIQGCGFTAPQAGGVLMFMLVIAIAGRVTFGMVADRFGSLPAWMIASAWQTLLVFGFTLIDSLPGFYAYAAIYGFGYAGVMTGLLTTVRNYSPPQHRARINGLVMAFTYTGHGVGGYQGGLFYDFFGGYGVPYANAAAAGLLNLAILAMLFHMIHRRRRPIPT